MIEPTDADIAEALRLLGFKETLADDVRDWPQDFLGEWEVARTLAKLRVAMEALEKVARDRGATMGEYHADCQQVARESLAQIKEGTRP